MSERVETACEFGTPIRDFVEPLVPPRCSAADRSAAVRCHLGGRPGVSASTSIPRWLTGGPDAAMAILTTIAVSMVSLATLVLTITMVVVQLAMGQFSPRIVQTFLRDRPSQLAIGLFVATFAHAMLAMREVQFDGDGQVPGIAIASGTCWC